MKKTGVINVLFASFEAAPFIKTGGLGDVAGSLPEALRSKNLDIRVIMPKLSAIPEDLIKDAEFVESYYVPLSWRNQYCGLFKLVKGKMTYYFLDNEFYFKRNRVYGEFDDAERVGFFSKAVLESIEHMDDFHPDIIHCNDWHTALIPVFLHEHYMKVPGFDRIKTVYTTHNLKFQGQFSDFVLGNVLGLEGTSADHQLRQKNGGINFTQAAVRYADRVTTVSRTYAEEICGPYYGEGLDGLLREYSGKLCGIVNGIDTKDWNPARDRNIAKKYKADDLSGKAACKAALQRELGLEENPDVPLLAIVSRLTEQKGFDLVLYDLPYIEGMNAQLAILGTGERKFEDAFRYHQGIHPDKIAVRLEFDEALSHRFYAGSDIFVMPSRFEPCGLSQMISMRYGTLPIVRETGGLKDTVIPYNRYTGEGTGFSFSNYNGEELMDKIREACALYSDNREAWQQLMRNAMSVDFSWKAAAKEYKKIYSSLV